MVNYRSIDQGTFERVIINDNARISINRNFSAQVLERVGEDGTLLNAFWSDARSRDSYKYFGDVITFDTTFSLNRFRMPFAPFIGINHHGSSIIFGAALITHEDTETFVWVFEQFLKCMGTKPKGICTDQCRAIGRVVEVVFPSVPHIFCLWHLLQNAMKNLGTNANWKDIDRLIHTTVHDMMDQEEFYEAWCIIMDKYGLREAGWMKEQYETRSQWAPAYCRGTFWAGMSSTQRSEGLNRFFKTQVNLQCGLLTFVKRYEQALKIKAAEEADNNLKTREKPLKFNKTILAEYVFQKSYTNAMFAKVKKECEGLLHTNFTKKDYALGSAVFYVAVERFPTVIRRKKVRTFDVTCDKVNGEFSCSCKLFEFRGILCRHIICAMSIEDVEFIPEKYILQRWKKDARSYENIKVSYYDPEESAVEMKATDKIRLTLEDLVGIRKTGELGDESKPWWDLASRSVFGRRRLRPRENNERELVRNAQPAEEDEGCIKTPMDKRRTGRGKTRRTTVLCDKRRKVPDAAVAEEIATKERRVFRKVSRTVHHPFTRFLICQNYKQPNGCSFFEWIDNPHPIELSIEMVNVIKRNKDLEEDASDQKKKILVQSCVILFILATLILVILCKCK
ncbi:protein FAR1-RELATED SEQUENCE 5-like [Spinacia oleracea]|uniref:Protein FAR1-RELATED SEQUENCE 5-like n=1 Tax=Spinacia oleracea TaxID=3562 RepID=A0ABM3RI44_SPIOL|nr:protein FAR1-RELATED SEQUENCE 5-like [Spinacia oleracea]